MNLRSSAHSDVQEQDLTVFLYEPYDKAYEAISYPSIWKAREHSAYTIACDEFQVSGSWSATDARQWMIDTLERLVDELVEGYFLSQVSDGVFYSCIREHVWDLSVKQTAILDIAVQAVEGSPLEKIDDAPEWFEDLPSIEGDGSLLMDYTLRIAEQKWDKERSRLTLIKREDFLTTGEDARYRMAVRTLSGIVAEAWNEMEFPADENYPLMHCMPEEFYLRVASAVRFVIMSSRKNAADRELTKIIRRWDRYLTWFNRNADGFETENRLKESVLAMKPLADFLQYDLSHHHPVGRQPMSSANGFSDIFLEMFGK